LNTLIVSRLEFFCLAPNGARRTESHIIKKLYRSFFSGYNLTEVVKC